MQKASNALLFPVAALGIYLGSQGFFNPAALGWSFLITVLIWLISVYRGRAPTLFVVPLALGMLFVGHLVSLPEQAWENPVEGDFLGRVYAVQSLSYDQRVLVRLSPSRLKVAVHLPQDWPVQIGQEILFRGKIERPPKAPNPGVFCYRDYLRRQEVYGVSYPESFELRGSAKPRLVETVRRWMRSNLEKHLRDPGLALALVLGDREGLSSSRRENWRLLGISHLLAISGMHVGFAAFGLSFVLNRLPFRPQFKLLCLQGLLLAYILLTGTGASGWRALVVSVLGGYAGYRGLQYDSLQLWASAGLLLLLDRPSLIYDLGFQLSFAASGGILLWGPTLRVRLGSRFLDYIVNSLLISTAAQFAVAPFVLASFGELALVGPLATLLFLPFVVVVLLGGFLVALGFGPLALFLNPVLICLDALERLLLPWAFQWKFGNSTLPEIYTWWMLFVWGGWRLRRPRLTKPKRSLVQLFTWAVVLLFIGSLPPAVRRPLEVTALNVGQGDCFYVRTPSGVHLLLDGGGDSPYWQERGRNVGRERVVPYLRHRQVERLDYVILSHPHEDHLFGLLAVLQEFEVGMVIDNGHEHTSPTYERYLDLIRDKGIAYHSARAGEVLELGDGITLTVLYPAELRPNLPAAYNNNSLLLRLDYGGVGMLFTGDLEAPVLYDLAQERGLALRAQWLKVPHHGSKGSLVQEFYDAVDPVWALISVGENNFGHPHREVLTALEERKVSWRTTLAGPQTFEVWWGLWGRFRPGPS